MQGRTCRRPGIARALLCLGIAFWSPVAWGGAALALDSGPVVLVGERHRTPSIHRWFGDRVEAWAASGERLVVGLEIPADRQGALDRLVRGGSPAGIAPPVIGCPSYERLLGRLGRLSASSHGRLRLVALDLSTGWTGDRDAHMARVVRQALADDADRVVALLGNLHVLKVGGGHPSVARRLADAGVVTESLVSGDPAGTHWRKMPPDDPTARRAVARLWALRAGQGPPPAGAADGVLLAD